MWTPLINNDIRLEVQMKVSPTKGNLVYEYNPFRNYRLSKNMYEYKNSLYSEEELYKDHGIFIAEYRYGQDYFKTEQELKAKYPEATGEFNIIQTWAKNGSVISSSAERPILRESGELVDFITDEFKCSLEHPIHIVPQASYDGSVNLIINDGLNIPRLINSRFSATGKNTYEIIDRKGNNDTNIYDQGEQFDIDTSLYKRIVKIPKIDYLGSSAGGNLKVGNYHFYFKLSDADGNETDFVGESGLVSVFIGFGTPHSTHSGERDENSYKNVTFAINNIDPSYDYVKVYYSRTSAELDRSSQTEYVKINKKYPINNSGSCLALITGYENIENIDSSDINLNYNVIQSSATSATCQNMLFMANVKKPDIPYEELADLSLRFLPYLKQEEYKINIDQNYAITSSEQGYYDSKFIHDKTGYWGEELYRFGIVYIMPNNELTPVFNIRGGVNIQECSKTSYKDGQFSNCPVYDNKGIRQKIVYDEETNYLLGVSNKDTSQSGFNKGSILFENTKGVVRFAPTKDTDIIYGIDIRTDDDTLQELKKYVKGYFFVRQNRIPTILAQGITMGIDQTSYTPCIATADGFLNELSESLEKTHVTTEDINDVNYISEGFLSRYQFKFKKKSSSLFGSILKGMTIAVGVVALAAATVFTAGAAGALVAGATVAGAASAGVSALAVAAGVGGVVVGAAAVETMTAAALVGIGTATIAGAAAVATGTVMALAGGVQETRYAIGRLFAKKKLDGRNTKTPSGYKIVETDESRKLDQDFYNRFIPKDPSKVKVQAIICPDYSVNQAYFNQVFTGNHHVIQLTATQSVNGLSGHSSNYFSNDKRHFYIPYYYDMNVRNQYNFKIIGVPDNIKLVGLDDLKFRSRAGEAEEAWRYECIGEDYKSERMQKDEKAEEDSETRSNKQINTDIIRGSFGPYLAFNDIENKFSPAETVNIYIPDYSLANLEDYITIRMQDSSVFSAISVRYDIKDSDENLINKLTNIIGDSTNRNNGYSWELYRGDCYLCQYTHRLNRNFNDPAAPYNDEIVDEYSWKDHYDPENPEKYEDINLGDINAIQLGMWVTFKIRSSYNLNIRTLDSSNVDENTMTGHPHGFYPYHDMSVEGTFKHPESQIYNKGFAKSLSERWNFELPDVPHIKNWFGTRIMYSDIHINDAYKNGFRVFQGNHYRDYTREYGEIVKLVPFESSLLCVFEHGIALIPVNERAVAGQGAGGNVYINTSNVLPENPKIISDMFGSQWPESVLKVPGRTGDAPQYVYGVDTIAKKIWRTDGNAIECISDFKVQEFLNNNITLGERELTPKVGIRNVKTHYNAFKRDVMFTFYDNTYGFEEKVWNLCWNELLQKFVTFYSWVPSYMENINNIPFSFNRETSKWVAKLGTSHTECSFADGITLSNVITNDRIDTVNNYAVDNFSFDFTYINKSGEKVTKQYKISEKPLDLSFGYDEGVFKPYGTREKFIGVLSLSNRVLPDSQLFYTISYELQKDNKMNYKKYDIRKVLVDGQAPGGITLPEDAMYAGKVVPVYGLYFNTGDEEYSKVYYLEGENYQEALDPYDNPVYTYESLYNVESMLSELYYRNSAGNAYADYDTHKLGTQSLKVITEADEWFRDVETMEDIISRVDPETPVGNAAGHDESGNPLTTVHRCTTVGQIADILYYRDDETPMVHGIPLNWHWTMKPATEERSTKVHFGLPIFKDITGKRPMLPKSEQVNPDNIVTLLNIKAHINIEDNNNTNKLSDAYYNLKANFATGTSLVNVGYYESVVALAPRWNLQFLSTDFWKHGQAGLIDIADDIYPTYWYGKQHPFEFECIVVNDPSVHKIFQNLELVSNKAKPESFHYEIIGESYDFAKDKVNMYFRQEALKALWQYNGADICYDRNFLKVQPKQQPKSADLPHKYYTRQDTINDIEDYYVNITYPQGYDYRHLSGAEIVYYPTRQEYRIWNHAKAVSLDDLSSDDSRSIIAANCKYLEDRWKITINPIIICYRNEYAQKFPGSLIQPQNSTWAEAAGGGRLPSLPIYNSPIPDQILAQEEIRFPEGYGGKENALYGLYKDLYEAIDTTNWLNSVNIYKTSFGEAQNRKELDLKDKFIKVRIRYSGEELAVIDFLNTIYRISYA